MKSSVDYYNTISKAYRDISSSRQTYLDAIDDYIIEEIGQADSFLDVGAGDGRRSFKIAAGVKAEQVTLLDNSPQIAANIATHESIEVVIESIENFKTKNKYNLITCLWNVLGHVGDKAARQMFFKRAKELLAVGGHLVLDVNNRYNINHYGNKNVMNNLSKDLKLDETAGWFNLGTEENKTLVYVHAPLEIEAMAEKEGLSVKKVEYIDYKTGDKMETFFEGQLLYYIKHKTF